MSTTTKTLLEYIWIDFEGNPRGKTMVFDGEAPSNPSKLPLWNYDGSSTGQGTTNASDVIIRPVAIFSDPFRGGHHKIVLTETLNPDMTPHTTNFRAKANEVFSKVNGSHVPQYGMEQEYVLLQRNKAPREVDGVTNAEHVPYKWLGHDEPGFGEQGPYYCSAGGATSFGREIAEEHLEKCLLAGLKICGVNAEVMPSQWEFQIGICSGIEMGDHLQVARYLLHRVSEKYDVHVSLHPKPYKGDWNGSGLHTNFSTLQMREGSNGRKGLEFVKEGCEKICNPKRAEAHMSVYGKFNKERLTGKHETAGFDECTWGMSDRSKSIRIPVMVARNGKGYLEDRRVASNADPYLVSKIIAETVCL